jgi:ubiquinone biosynthesis monooxygenase Coq7
MAKSEKTRQMLQHAALEETDHLAWTHQRLEELHSHRSYLSAFWYFNAFCMGVLVSAVGDKWSLGFVEETERQVSEHLQGHLQKLPAADLKSRAIVQQMKADEEQHGQSAVDAGAQPLPGIVKTLMRSHAKVMTALAYYI